MKTIQSLVILAGGASSRMKRSMAEANEHLSPEEIAQANERSKGLITLGDSGYPLIDYLLFNAREAGIKKVVFLTGANSLPFREHFEGDRGDYHGLETHFAIQHIPEGRVKPLGTADALLQTLDQQPWLKKERFIVCNSDNLYSTAAFSLLKGTSAPNAFISYDRDALEFSTERINRFALVKTDKDHYLADIIEKPTASEAAMYRDPEGKFRVSMNIFMFSGDQIYPYLVNCPMNPERREKELPTALLNMLHDHGQSVLALPLAEHVPDLTSKEDIAILKKRIRDRYPEKLWD